MLESNRHILEVGDVVLKWINENIDPNAAIVGGAARDGYLERPIKDIDIALRVPVTGDDSEELLEQYYEVWNRLNASIPPQYRSHISMPCFCKNYAEKSTMDWCDEVIKCTVGTVNIDLLCLKVQIDHSLQNVFDGFDFGLCRIGRRNKQYVFSPEFRTDVLNRTITLLDTTRDQEDMNRVVNDHLVRIQNKYPEFTPKGLPDDIK